MGRLRLLLTAGLVAAGLAVAAYLGGALDALENSSIDKRFQVRGAQAPSDIAVIAVDDITFSDLKKQWPFLRREHARAIDALHRAGAREIVYDVQFTEPTTNAQDLVDDRLRPRAAQPVDHLGVAAALEGPGLLVRRVERLRVDRDDGDLLLRAVGLQPRPRVECLVLQGVPDAREQHDQPDRGAEDRGEGERAKAGAAPHGI